MVKVAAREPYTLIYAPQVWRHLRAIDRQFHSWIRKAIEEQLQYQPEVETRDRKPLTRPVEFEADWEIRFGPKNRFRVFYRIVPKSHEVHILAVGVKEGNRLWIAGQEVSI